jgi:peptide/nickel transport system permease protein
MTKYIIRRLLLAFPTLIIITIVVFMTVRLIPGDIIDLMFAELQSADFSREDIAEYLGIDDPIHIQYFEWVGGIILRGDLGTALHGRDPVRDRLVDRLPVSLELGAMALVISIILAVPIGIYSAIRQDTWGDYIGRTFAIVFISVPSFWFATIVVLYPAIWWRWAPRIEYIPITEDPIGNLIQFLVPGTILGLLMCGTTMRMTRTMMLEVLRQDYIRTAWSKGLRERVVVSRHALKNAFIPVITLIGLEIPVLVGGTIIIEQIFALPGIGLLTLDALSRRDYTVVSGLNLMIAVFILIINLVVDLTYGWFDPRVRYE